LPADRAFVLNRSSNGLTPDNANLKGSMSSLGSSNGHLASSNSATDVSALDSASIADDRSLRCVSITAQFKEQTEQCSTGSPHHSPSDSLAALHTSMSIPDNLDQLGASLGTTLEGLDASMEKLKYVPCLGRCGIVYPFVFFAVWTTST